MVTTATMTTPMVRWWCCCCAVAAAAAAAVAAAVAQTAGVNYDFRPIFALSVVVVVSERARAAFFVDVAGSSLLRPRLSDPPIYLPTYLPTREFMIYRGMN